MAHDSHQKHSLLPVHPQPHPGELLSAWMERSAVRSGADYRYFASRGFGLSVGIDIDRQLGAKRQRPAGHPEPYKKRLAARLGQSEAQIERLSLVRYAPRLYAEEGPARIRSRRPPWVIPARTYTAANRAPQGRRYPYCPKCYPTPGKGGFVRRVWRLAFVVACPVHGIWLRPASGEDEDAESPQEEDLRGSDLLTAQMMMFSALFSGEAPIACGRPSGKGTLSAGEFFAGVGVFMSALSSTKRGFYLRAFLEREAGVEPRPDYESGRKAFEMMPLSKRRYLMQLLAWVLVDWPERSRELCLRVGIGKRTFSRFRANVEGSDWLNVDLLSSEKRLEILSEEALSGREDAQFGTRPDRLQGLDLGELLQLDPELEAQFERVGLGLSEVKSAIPSKKEWSKAQGVFYSRSRFTHETKGLIQYRTLFGLLVLTLRRGAPGAGMLPPILARRVRAAFSKWERDGRLEAAFSRLPRTLDPRGLIDWTAERERLEGKTWDASRHYQATSSDEGPDASLLNGDRLARRRVFLKGGKAAILRPLYFDPDRKKW